MGDAPRSPATAFFPCPACSRLKPGGRAPSHVTAAGGPFSVSAAAEDFTKDLPHVEETNRIGRRRGACHRRIAGGGGGAGLCRRGRRAGAETPEVPHRR